MISIDTRAPKLLTTAHPGAAGLRPGHFRVGEPLRGERVTGIEPATLCLASTRSSQLSYTRDYLYISEG